MLLICILRINCWICLQNIIKTKAQRTFRKMVKKNSKSQKIMEFAKATLYTKSQKHDCLNMGRTTSSNVHMFKWRGKAQKDSTLCKELQTSKKLEKVHFLGKSTSVVYPILFDVFSSSQIPSIIPHALCFLSLTHEANK